MAVDADDADVMDLPNILKRNSPNPPPAGLTHWRRTETPYWLNKLMNFLWVLTTALKISFHRGLSGWLGSRGSKRWLSAMLSSSRSLLLIMSNSSRTSDSVIFSRPHMYPFCLIGCANRILGRLVQLQVTQGDSYFSADT